MLNILKNRKKPLKGEKKILKMKNTELVKQSQWNLYKESFVFHSKTQFEQTKHLNRSNETKTKL